MASCCRRLNQPARIKSKNCHGCNGAFIFLRMYGANSQHPASWVTCQAAYRSSAVSSPRHVFSVACGSAEYFDHTAGRQSRQRHDVGVRSRQREGRAQHERDVKHLRENGPPGGKGAAGLAGLHHGPSRDHGDRYAVQGGRRSVRSRTQHVSAVGAVTGAAPHPAPLHASYWPDLCISSIAVEMIFPSAQPGFSREPITWNVRWL
jgi:hypothetical protein